MSVTRLSIYGGIGIPYGAFSGKTEAPVVAPSATVAGGVHRKRRQRRFRVEYQGQVFYVLGEDRAEALLTALEQLAHSETDIQIKRIRLKPIRRTKIEMVEDEIGERLRRMEEDDEEELLEAILTSIRFH